MEARALAIIEHERARREYTFEPLEITFTLQSPVVLTYPWINLDGYIAYETGQDILGSDWALFQDKNPRAIWDALPVPIERWCTVGDMFIYMCSVGRFSNPGAISSRQYNKMFCSEGLGVNDAKKKSYMIVGGQFKLRCIRYPLNYSTSITFWCRGDKATLERYCSNIVALGTRTAAGNGRIGSCNITSIPEDRSIEHPEFGINRPVPVKMANGLSSRKLGEIAMLSCRPPNWSKPNHVLCRVPEGFA